MNTIQIAKNKGHIPMICTSQRTYNRLSKAELRGCPFKNYYALDLLRDLFVMYDWKMETGHAYTIDEFLTLCNDAHAEVYRYVFKDCEL